MATWIIGVSALYHDAAAALIKDGVTIAAAQEERFSRVKNDPSLPIKSIKWLLSENNLTIDDIDHFVFYEKPLRKFERILFLNVLHFPFSWRTFPIHMHAWLGDKLWIRSKLTKTFNIPKEKLLFSEHHLSHAASAFFCSPFEEAAILTLDGVGEWATTSLWTGNRKHPYIRPLAEIRYPHSLGIFYSAVTAHLGFMVNNGEYKVMGMAPFGTPRFKSSFDKMITLSEDGSFKLNFDYFCHHINPKKATTALFEKELGPPRTPGTPFNLSTDAPEDVRKSSQLQADIAASAQQKLEEVLLHIARCAKEKTGATKLCLAGGVALNACANRVLAASGLFNEIWTHPAAGDAGGAIGAALWAWHDVLRKKRTPNYFQPFLGKEMPSESIEEFLLDFKMNFKKVEKDLIESAAKDLADGKLIAWHQGRFEWGPRALGHRSILADPRKEETKERINKSVKFREPFRPFAPVCLEEEADTYFDIPDPARPMLPYMLCTVGVKADAQSKLEAITHVDGSARLQTLNKNQDPKLYDLIKAFNERTQIPVLLNTSFNLKGDPMANSVVDAVATFIQSDLDVLYIDNYRVEQRRKRKKMG